MKNIKNIKNVGLLILILITTVLGLLFVITTCPKSIEGFDLPGNCSNLLIEKDDGRIYLVNTLATEVPGINPLIFNNLEDYVEYFEWQRAHNIDCPVLFLQHTYDAQGDAKYIKRPSPFEQQGGLPSMQPEVPNSRITKLLDAYHTHHPFNKNMYPGFDPQNQYIGLTTPLDQMFNQSFDGVSPNPMDPNWAGSELTQTLVDNGYYESNKVYKVIGDKKPISTDPN